MSISAIVAVAGITAGHLVPIAPGAGSSGIRTVGHLPMSGTMGSSFELGTSGRRTSSVSGSRR